MALFEKLSASSSPQEIADAYKEFTGMAGGDNAANQKLAVDYLSTLGVGTPTIEQAYSAYTAPPASSLSAVTSGQNTVLEDTSNGSLATPTVTSNLPTNLVTTNATGVTDGTTTPTGGLPVTNVGATSTSTGAGSTVTTPSVTETLTSQILGQNLTGQ
jgi:hypothetical protein